jgi:hypothetical protein
LTANKKAPENLGGFFIVMLKFSTAGAVFFSLCAGFGCAAGVLLFGVLVGRLVFCSFAAEFCLAGVFVAAHLHSPWIMLKY